MMNRIFIEQNPTDRVDQDQLPARAARQTASCPPSGQKMRTAPARLSAATKDHASYLNLKQG